MSDRRAMDEVLAELLADHAVGQLDPGRERELADRTRGLPFDEAESFDRAAAAVHLAFASADLQPLPEGLRARLERQADAWSVPAPDAPSAPDAEGPRPTAATAPESPLASPWLGWLAAAACLLLAVGAWTRGLPVDAPSSEEQWAELAALADATRIEWSEGPDALGQGVTGTVLWSQSEQRGFMRFRGLPVNDPGANQYQLWIFDGERSADHPVDGGVFDATDGELLVPIDAKLSVGQPSLFAVTYERAGGVVVSGREHIVVTAAL